MAGDEVDGHAEHGFQLALHAEKVEDIGAGQKVDIAAFDIVASRDAPGELDVGGWPQGRPASRSTSSPGPLTISSWCSPILVAAVA